MSDPTKPYMTVPAPKRPVVLENDCIAFFDVDETLVLWNYPPERADETILIGCKDFRQSVLVHEKHVEQIKRHKARQHLVVVWSQGGYDWARAVVQALKLEEYVDLICRKPTWYWDDLPASEFMGRPAYIDPNGSKTHG